MAQLRWKSKPPVGTLIDQSHPLARGLQGCWLFNERAGNTQNLYTGHVATVQNSGASWLDAGGPQGGPCYTFGANRTTGRLTTNEGSIFQYGTGDFAWSIWFRTTYASGLQIAIGFYGGSGSQNYFSLSSAGVPHFEINGAAINATGAYKDGKWHLMTGTRLNGNTYIYVDMIQEVTGSTANSVSATGSLAIGQYGDQTGFGWVGELDFPRIWNRGITLAEHQQMFLDPYCMFEFPRVRRGYGISGGGGTNLNVLLNNMSGSFNLGLSGGFAA